MIVGEDVVKDNQSNSGATPPPGVAPLGLAPPGFCGAFDIRIARDGVWHHEGRPIRRIELVKLFSRVLRKDENGVFRLVTPYENGVIQVDDAPFVAVELRSEEGRLSLRTNIDEWVTIDAAHPLRVETDPETETPRPYVLVRDRLEALIQRAAFYHLVEQGESATVNGQERFGVWSCGQFFPLD
jgi:hypothetical protein